MTAFGAALSSLTQEAYKPRLTDFGGGKNAKSLYGLSPRCNDLVVIKRTALLQTKLHSQFSRGSAYRLNFIFTSHIHQERAHG